MNQDSPQAIYIGYLIGYFNSRDVVEWAEKYFSNSAELADDPDYIELISINTGHKFELEKVGDYLQALIKNNWPHFDVSGPESEAMAGHFLRERMEQYLQDKCSPDDVCKLVTPIESLFDFPDWLGDMYNVCDWDAPDNKPFDDQYLKAEIRTLLQREPWQTQ